MQSFKNRFMTFKPWTRHGGILVVAGFVYILVGVLYIVGTETDAQAEALYFALHLMSMNAWGVGFIVTGTIALISSRWPNWPKSWGYTVLTGWSAAWAAFYFSGALFTEAKVVYFGTAGVWALLAYLWWAVSGLISPSKDEV